MKRDFPDAAAFPLSIGHRKQPGSVNGIASRVPDLDLTKILRLWVEQYKEWKPGSGRNQITYPENGLKI